MGIAGSTGCSCISTNEKILKSLPSPKALSSPQNKFNSTLDQESDREVDKIERKDENGKSPRSGNGLISVKMFSEGTGSSHDNDSTGITLKKDPSPVSQSSYNSSSTRNKGKSFNEMTHGKGSSNSMLSNNNTNNNNNSSSSNTNPNAMISDANEQGNREPPIVSKDENSKSKRSRRHTFFFLSSSSSSSSISASISNRGLFGSFSSTSSNTKKTGGKQNGYTIIESSNGLNANDESEKKHDEIFKTGISKQKMKSNSDIEHALPRGSAGYFYDLRNKRKGIGHHHHSRRHGDLNGNDKHNDEDDDGKNAKLQDKYELTSQRLGKGHYAVVYSAVNKQSGDRVAVKIIDKKKSKKERLALEIAILKSIEPHPHIIHLYDVYETPDQVQLVMELVQGGELFEHLVQGGQYCEADAARHIRGIASAIHYLHSQGIVHRDLKPENLLLTSWDEEEAIVKIADFGLAKLIAVDPMKTVCGTWAYAAPEVRNKKGSYGPKCDCWSIGVIMFIMLSGYHPFDPNGNFTDDQIWSKIEVANYDFKDPAWDNISGIAKDLITKLLVLDPEQRLSARKILKHPWVKRALHTPISSSIGGDLKKIKKKNRQQKNPFLDDKGAGPSIPNKISEELMEERDGESKVKSHGTGESNADGGSDSGYESDPMGNGEDHTNDPQFYDAVDGATSNAHAEYDASSRYQQISLA